MEQARSLHLLLHAELRSHSSPHAEDLAPLYEQVTEFVAEEEGLSWSVFLQERVVREYYQYGDIVSPQCLLLHFDQ